MKDYFILKNACRRIYLSGVCDFWFEKGAVGNDESFLYKLCSRAMFIVYIFVTILEILAVSHGGFPDDEKSDALAFSLSHTIVLIKFFSVMLQKDVVKTLNRDIIRVCEKYENNKKMEAKYKAIRINVLLYFLSVYGSAVFYVCEGFRKLFIDGTHFVTVVTYYPSFEDNSHIAAAFRIFCTIVLYLMMLPMTAVDSLVVTLLISIKYKFITLRNYFEDLQEEFHNKEKSISLDEASDNLKRRVIDGIVMHQELLRITKNFDKSFGFLLALQVCLCFTSDIALLLSLALNEQNSFANVLKMVIFLLAILFLLALFLCNAGEITYQASLLSGSIFYCGWHACSKSRQHHVAQLVLFTCAVAQRPLVMKAFKMLNLTYGTFISVIRAMYSVFALIYAQNKE